MASVRVSIACGSGPGLRRSSLSACCFSHTSSARGRIASIVSRRIRVHSGNSSFVRSTTSVTPAVRSAHRMRSPSRDSNRVHSSPSQSVEEGCGGVDGDAPTTWTASLSRKRLVLATAGFLRIVLPFLPPLVLSPLRPQLRQLRPLLGCENAPHLEHHHRARLSSSPPGPTHV